MSDRINLVLSGDTLEQGRLKVNDALTSITAVLISFGDLTSTGLVTITNIATSGYGNDLVITAGLSAATISAGNLIIENPASALLLPEALVKPLVTVGVKVVGQFQFQPT